MKTIQLTSCDNLIEATFIKDKLNNEGIDCFLTNENITNLMPTYNNMLGSGIQIFISEDDFQRASVLLKEYKALHTEKKTCPYCGSDQIVYGFGKTKVMNVVYALFMLLPFVGRKQKFYCKKCRHEIIEEL